MRLYRGFIDYPYYLHLNTLNIAAVLTGAGHEAVVADSLFCPVTRLWDINRDYWGFGAPAEDLGPLLPPGPFDAIVVRNTPYTNLQWEDGELKHTLARLAAHYGQPPMVLADGYLGGQHRVDVVSAAILGDYGLCAYAQDEAEGVLPGLLEEVAPPQGAATPANPLVRRGNPHTAPQPAPLLPGPQQVRAQRELVGHFFAQARRRPDFGEIGLTLATHTSRGCVYSCTFCTSNPQGDPHSFRPYDLSVLKNHWRKIQEAVGLERLVILDELANGRPSHFEQLLNIAGELNMGLSFPNGLRADLLKEKHITRLAGRCPRLSISAESASDDLRQGDIGKRLAPGKIEQTARWAHAAGLPLLIHYMVGYPHETVAQVNETFAQALSLQEQFGAVAAMQSATPLPGSRLHAQLKQDGLLAQETVKDYQPWFHQPGLVKTSHFTPAQLAQAMHWFRVKQHSLTPEKVIFNLTYVCNNQCTFCATGNRFKGHADLDYYQQLLREHYQRGIRLVDFDGGEPTLYPHFLKVLRYARQLGYEKINLTTNGRLLAYEGTAQKVLRSGLTELLISFHGHTAHYHEHQTRAAGSYDQTLAGIKNILNLGGDRLARFGVNFTLTAHNAPIVADYVAFVRELGVRRVNIQFVTPFGRARGQDTPDPAQAAPFVRAALEQFGHDMDLQVINLPFCFLPGLEQHLSGDVAKAARTMVFVSEQEVNLGKFLEVTRRKTDQCADCLYAVACDGFYDFDRAESAAGAVPLNTAQVGGRG